jgi:hypothetical protein
MEHNGWEQCFGMTKAIGSGGAAIGLEALARASGDREREKGIDEELVKRSCVGTWKR